MDAAASPKLMDDAVELACKLIKSFDDLEEKQKYQR